MTTQPSRCREYSSDSRCNVKRLQDMSLEVGAWGCAPWIGLWFILVFFAPASLKAKIQIFLVGLGILVYALVNIAIGNTGPTADTVPLGIRTLLGIIAIPLAIAYFYLSYSALIQENRKRKALYTMLGDAKWRRSSYCTVHDQVINE